MEAPNRALGKRVRCPLCGEAFTASLPKAVVMEELPPAELEPPPPGFADYSDPLAEPPRAKELIAQPVDDDDLEVIEPAHVVKPPARAAAQSPPGPAGIIDALQGRSRDDAGPMSETLAALHGQTPADQDDEDDDSDVITTELAEEEVDEALSALSGAGSSLSGSARPSAARGNQWYIVSDEVEYGPYKGQAILAAVRAGKLSRHMVLHDATAEVEVTVAQLLQAMARQGSKGQPRRKGGKALSRTKRKAATSGTTEASGADPGVAAQPVSSAIPGLSADRDASGSASSATGPSASPGDSSPADGLHALLGELAADSSEPASSSPVLASNLAQAAFAAPRPARPARRPGLTLSDLALLLAGLALACAAGGLLLPWLKGGGGQALRLGEMARPWAWAFGALTLSALVLAGALVFVPRWRGRRLACACLLVMCMGALIVQALALKEIRATYKLGGLLDALGAGAWLGTVGVAAAGVLAALAAFCSPRGPRA